MNLNVIFKALASPLRRRILAWLKQSSGYVAPLKRERVGATAGELQQLSGLAQSTVSAHLKILISAALVTQTKVGQVCLYHRNELMLNTLKEHASRVL